jgi:hypothetical protein
MWYVAQICIALDTPLDEIIKMNIEKLLKRYPEGYFDAFYSEIGSREIFDMRG